MQSNTSMNIITCDPDKLKALTLLLHPSAARLSQAAHRLMGARGWPLSFVSRIVSAGIDSPRGRSARVIRQRLERNLTHGPATPTILNDVVLLFEPSLKIDPLRLLTQLARGRRLVVAWPGSATGSTLAYAVPEHAHYRTWPLPDATIIPL